MNWKSFIIGAAVGAISGYALRDFLWQKISISPEKALEHVKEQFKKQGSISGSWIQLEAQPYEKKQIHYKVYKGGISKIENGESKPYEFIVDASTGTILKVHPL